MISFLLATLVYLQHLDCPPSYYLHENVVSRQLTQALLDQRYHPSYTVTHQLPPVPRSPFFRPSRAITAASAAVIDVASGQILWQRQPTAVLPIASLTKLTTAVVFLGTSPDFSQEVIIEKEDNANSEGSALQVKTGERLTAGDLFYSSLVGSANNATRALARSTGLSNEEFVSRMNTVAQQLGLTQTTFHEVTGLDPTNTSVVNEYAQLARYAFTFDRIRQAATMAEYRFRTMDKKIEHKIKNTDALLTDSDVQLVGAKTGYLDEAGYTFAMEATVQGHDVLIVLFKSETSQTRFAEAKALLTWVGQAYYWL